MLLPNGQAPDPLSRLVQLLEMQNLMLDAMFRIVALEQPKDEVLQILGLNIPGYNAPTRSPLDP